jgi:hypothetical protein
MAFKAQVTCDQAAEVCFVVIVGSGSSHPIRRHINHHLLVVGGFQRLSRGNERQPVRRTCTVNFSNNTKRQLNTLSGGPTGVALREDCLVGV